MRDRSRVLVSVLVVIVSTFILCASNYYNCLIARYEHERKSANATRWDAKKFTLSDAVTEEEVIRLLSEAITYKTVSSREDTAEEFNKFDKFLRKSFPLLVKELEAQHGEYYYCFKWNGEDSDLLPVLLLSHVDVVDADETTLDQWKYPPFSGELAEGFIWGRGTLDNKGGAISILTSIETLLRKGHKPRRTIYVAMGKDEEIGGNNGAVKLAERFEAEGIQFEFVLDEGSCFTYGYSSTYDGPLAAIGSGEKGIISFELIANMSGGHSAAPPYEYATKQLIYVLNEIEQLNFETRMPEDVAEELLRTSPYTSMWNGLMNSNLWLFKPIVSYLMTNNPSTNAKVKTTAVTTIISGGSADNIIPQIVKATVNVRLIPGETINEIEQTIQKIAAEKGVRVTKKPKFNSNPSFPSPVDTKGFRLLEDVIHEAEPSALVTPTLMIGGTDCRYFHRVSKNLYRFLPYIHKAERKDSERFHTVNERINAEEYVLMVKFLIRLISRINEI